NWSATSSTSPLLPMPTFAPITAGSSASIRLRCSRSRCSTPPRTPTASPSGRAAAASRSMSRASCTSRSATASSLPAASPAFDPAHGNYTESVLKIDTTPNWSPANPQMMAVADYFTPFNWQTLDAQDADLGSGGVLLLPDSVGSDAHRHLMIETGKQGVIYL